MLTELHIENVAVVKNVTLSLDGGFTVLTGETGAGKSIIIDSINLLLGARSARELIRTGEKQALISACFTSLSEKAIAALDGIGASPDTDGTLYLQRVIQADGRATAKVNGRSVPVSMLKEIGAALITIHGQHDSQALLSPDSHIGFLDWYAGSGELLREYTDKYGKLSELRKRVADQTKLSQRLDEKIDTLKYQISEIDEARLRKNEEDELTERRKKVKSAEKIYKYTQIITSSLTDNGGAESAAALTERAIYALRQLTDLLPDAEMLAARLESARYDMIEAAEQAASLTDIDGASPEQELDRIENRLETVQRILRKYGPTEDDVFRYREKAAKELRELADFDANLAELKKRMNECAKETFAVAERLTALRTEAAERLSDGITEELRYLDLEKVNFSVSVGKLLSEKGLTRFSPTGCDTVEFLISTNPGEPLKPLAKIASGGELSRVMLAVKAVLAECDGTGTLIFDEIDTGVSGKTSQKIGIKLREISKCGQVICITHSAQIAAVAASHLKISKSESNGRTETAVTELTYGERVNELSRIMGGIEITDTARATAREMLKGSEQ
ncbi:MAG: DNA repair protein RecN [Clostridia bacterium]|nr:DNA repair protein RecN [Clostridia bacterium]